MGLFDNLLGQGSKVTLDVPKAVMIVMVAAVKADGIVEQDEIRQIKSICVWSPIFANNTTDEDRAIINFADSFTETEGVESAVKRAAAALSQPLRETAFTFATRIAFSDGVLGEKEKDFLTKLVSWLDLDTSRARQIVEVVSIMNHDASL